MNKTEKKPENTLTVCEYFWSASRACQPTEHIVFALRFLIALVQILQAAGQFGAKCIKKLLIGNQVNICLQGTGK